MFTGDADAATAIYVGELPKADDAAEKWRVAVLKDFDDLKSRGLAHKQMEEIELRLRATLVETCHRLTYNSNGPYQATGTPKSLDHKFITEDVPTGLIPMSALGTAAGVRTPAIDTLVEVVRSMTGKDFADDARTLECLGLSGMDGPQIRRVVEQGFS
jgi:hypothetical protein